MQTSRASAASGSAVGEDATHVTIWDAAGSGSAPSGGNLLVGAQAISNNPDMLASGDKYRIASGWTIATLTASGLMTERMARRMLTGAVTGDIWVQWHDGAPGTNGTSNVMNVARTRIQASQITVA